MGRCNKDDKCVTKHSLSDGMLCYSLDDCKKGHNCIRDIGISFSKQCQLRPYKNGYEVCVSPF
jgi:hypothetical protein